jgi:MATE family multidrug resistance protein
MSFIDTILMGVLGVSALAGGGLGAALFQFCMIVSFGVINAVANTVAYANGKNNQVEIREAFHAGLLLVILQCLFFGILLWNAKYFLLAMGQKPLIVDITMNYLHAVVWAMLPSLGFMLLRSLILGLGSAKSVLQISLLAAMMNYPISYFLMKGLGSWQGFGIAGIGYGTALVSICMLFAFIFQAIQQPQYKTYLKLLSWEFLTRHQMRQILRLGLPISFSLAMEVGLFSAAAMLAGVLGPVSLAAHQIALQCISLAFMLPLGISEAISIHVGQLSGSGLMHEIRKVTKIGLYLGSLCSLLITFVFFLFPNYIVHLFMFADAGPASQRDALESMGVKLLLVAALFLWVDAAQVILMGILRGLKHTLEPTFVTFFCYWCIGFPASWWLMGKWGVVGIWFGLGSGLAASALLLVCLLLLLTRKNTLKKDDIANLV